MQSKINRLKALAASNQARLTGAALLAAGSASTQAAISVAAVTDALADVGIVGLAVFGVYVAVRSFKWIRASL